SSPSAEPFSVQSTGSRSSWSLAEVRAYVTIFAGSSSSNSIQPVGAKVSHLVAGSPSKRFPFTSFVLPAGPDVRDMIGDIARDAGREPSVHPRGALVAAPRGVHGVQPVRSGLAGLEGRGELPVGLLRRRGQGDRDALGARLCCAIPGSVTTSIRRCRYARFAGCCPPSRRAGAGRRR